MGSPRTVHGFCTNLQTSCSPLLRSNPSGRTVLSSLCAPHDRQRPPLRAYVFVEPSERGGLLSSCVGALAPYWVKSNGKGKYTWYILLSAFASFMTDNLPTPHAHLDSVESARSVDTLSLDPARRSVELAFLRRVTEAARGAGSAILGKAAQIEGDSVSANLARMQSPVFKQIAHALEQTIPEDTGFGRFRP